MSFFNPNNWLILFVLFKFACISPPSFSTRLLQNKKTAVFRTQLNWSINSCPCASWEKANASLELYHDKPLAPTKHKTASSHKISGRFLAWE